MVCCLEGQFKVIVFTGTPASNACTVTIAPPQTNTFYMIYNNSNGVVTLLRKGGGKCSNPAVSSSAGVNILFIVTVAVQEQRLLVLAITLV